MKFSQLAKYFEEIERTSSRLKITHLLSELFKKLSVEEIDKTIYLLQGRVGPLFEGAEFMLAEKMVIKSATKALQLEISNFIKEFKKSGDLGKTVEHFKKLYRSFEERDLNIVQVYEDLLEITKKTGPKSQEAKINILAKLMSYLDPLSSRYIARIPVGDLRLGFSDMTVLDAFSWMIKKDKSMRPLFQSAYHVRPDLGYLGKQIKQKNGKISKDIKPALFTPVIMMRAERLPTGKEIIAKIGECLIEPKYDGFRLQIHFSKTKKEIRLYSRNLEDVSYMYPDIVEAVRREVNAREAIFEGEAIGYEPSTGSFLPFQETVQRKRKHDIEEKAKEIPLKLFVFDVLFLNGHDLLNSPLNLRHRKLLEIVRKDSEIRRDTIHLAQGQIVKEENKIESLFDDALSKHLEGIIAKRLDGTYQPGARNFNWIKFKRSYSTKVKDTLDCLVMGYDMGKGKRAGFGIGAFLVGVYDHEKDVFVTVSKVGTGLSDEEWRELKKRGDKYKTNKKPTSYEVDKLMEVDVWLKPKIVVEIRADEITRSPTHTAGRKMKSSKSGSALDVDVPGYALRFPRLERFRDDRLAEDATSVYEVEKLYRSQARR